MVISLNKDGTHCQTCKYQDYPCHRKAHQAQHYTATQSNQYSKCNKIKRPKIYRGFCCKIRKCIYILVLIHAIPYCLWLITYSQLKYDKRFPKSYHNISILKVWKESIHFEYPWMNPAFCYGYHIPIYRKSCSIGLENYILKSEKRMAKEIFNINRIFQNIIETKKTKECQFIAERIRSNQEIEMLKMNFNNTVVFIQDYKRRMIQLCENRHTNMQITVADGFISQSSLYDNNLEMRYYKIKASVIQHDLMKMKIPEIKIHEWSFAILHELIFYEKHFGMEIANWYYTNQINWIKSEYLDVFLKMQIINQKSEVFSEIWNAIFHCDRISNHYAYEKMTWIVFIFLQQIYNIMYLPSFIITLPFYLNLILKLCRTLNNFIN